MPASWKAAKRPEGRDGYDWGLTARGHVRWTGLELTWVARDGLESQIATLPEPGGLGTVTIVGDHVAFYRQRSDHNGDDWELFLWDSTKRRTPVKLDEADTQVPSKVAQLATTDDTHLAWLHPLADGRSEVRLHDLTTDRTRVVRVGREEAPLISGHLLLWLEAATPGAPARLLAADLRTLKRAALPKTLAELRDPQEMTADGRTYAWTTKDHTRLMVWRQGWPSPKVIVENTDGDPVTGPRVSGETVSWSAGRTYTADLRSSSYTPMTSQWGGAKVWGTFLHIGIPKVAGSGFLLDTSKLPPLPECGSRVRAVISPWRAGRAGRPDR